MTAYSRAANYARKLFETFDLDDACIRKVGHFDPHPTAWHRSGLQNLTGQAGLLFPVDVTCAADGALLALKSLAPDHQSKLPENGIQLVGERHHLLGLKGRDSISANGYTYLFDAADGRFALSLTRQEDIDILPALTFGAFEGHLDCLVHNRDDWLGSVRDIFKTLPVDQLVEQGVACGLPIASYGTYPPELQTSAWCTPHHRPSGIKTKPVRPPLVLDFTSLWAGPLAGSLLADIGATVIKVESTDRPDGSRSGNRIFYDLMNGRKQNLALNFKDPGDLKTLSTLIARADIILEGSRPRALKQLGLDAEQLVADMPGKTWVSITAHGRYGDSANRIGFGDDISVEAGFPTIMETHYGTPCFVGDAIADPFSGLHAAFAAYAGHLSGGGLIDLPMINVLRHVLEFGKSFEYHADMDTAGETAPYPSRHVRYHAGAHGADTDRLQQLVLTGEMLHADPTG